MEGLLPLIFKAIKKNRTRRQYECLSSRADLNCNAAGFFAHCQSEAYQTPPPQNGHRSVSGEEEIDDKDMKRLPKREEQRKHAKSLGATLASKSKANANPSKKAPKLIQRKKLPTNGVWKIVKKSDQLVNSEGCSMARLGVSSKPEMVSMDKVVEPYAGSSISIAEFHL